MKTLYWLLANRLNPEIPLHLPPKVIRNSDSITEVGEDASKTPASARHKRGCNCKKSNCLKKYCECYQGLHLLVWIPNKIKKMNIWQKWNSHTTSTFNTNVIKTTIVSTSQLIKQHAAFSTVSATSSWSFWIILIDTIAEERAEDIEDIENLIQSPVTNINAVSPNSKRVSLPHMESTETTPWRRNGGRKLLLSSIPTFPSLTPHTENNSLNL
ncbi:Protein tesmin/TSO1-like CXC 3 [Raphanus sativus]|nr:Protein tesmin/TSO1-like CXC 3 [Raphanus sativus]